MRAGGRNSISRRVTYRPWVLPVLASARYRATCSGLRRLRSLALSARSCWGQWTEALLSHLLASPRYTEIRVASARATRPCRKSHYRTLLSSAIAECVLELVFAVGLHSYPSNAAA